MWDGGSVYAARSAGTLAVRNAALGAVGGRARAGELALAPACWVVVALALEIDVLSMLGSTHAGSRGAPLVVLGVLVARMILGSKAGGRIVLVAGSEYGRPLGVDVGGVPRPTCATAEYVLPWDAAPPPARRTGMGLDEALEFVEVRRGRMRANDEGEGDGGAGEGGEKDMARTFSMLRVLVVLVGMGMLDDRFGRVEDIVRGFSLLFANLYAGGI